MNPKTEEPQSDARGLFDAWLRNQAEIHARLQEKILRDVRRVQETMTPAAPGTVAARASSAIGLTATVTSGGQARLNLVVENLQRVYCVVTPRLTPLVSEKGHKWPPQAADVSCLLAPEEQRAIELTWPVPSAVPAGVYRGGVALLGFSDGDIPVMLAVTSREESSADQSTTRSSRSRTRRARSA